MSSNARGMADKVDLHALVRQVTEGRRSGHARLDTVHGPATLWFRDGRIVDAEIGPTTGDGALARVLVTHVEAYSVSYDSEHPGDVAHPLHDSTRESGVVPAGASLDVFSEERLASGALAAPALPTFAAQPAMKVRLVAPPSLGGPGGDTMRPPRLEEADDLLQHRDSLPPLETAEGSGGLGAVVLGRYQVLRRIARGGMGTVYLCRATGEGGFRRRFALKVLRTHLARDPIAARMFLDEARLASRIYHPHVVGIVDVGSHEGRPFIVMDYVEGSNLHELLERNTDHRPVRLVVSVLLDALSGLHAVHTLTDDDESPLGPVHCDISPENLLIGMDGECRLSDFGSAKAAAASTSGVRQGKPAYSSPEHVTGRPLDARSDVFSMGVVLFTALTGERLFEADDMETTLQNVLAKPVPRPSSVGLRPPEVFDAVIRKALERDPRDRYQSAADMLFDLRRAAMSDGSLGASAEVARWMRETFDRASGAFPVSSGQEGAREIPSQPREGRVSSEGAPFRPESERPGLPPSVASPNARSRRGTLWAAVLLAVVAILTALLLRPESVVQLLDGEGAQVDALERNGASPGAARAGDDTRR